MKSRIMTYLFYFVFWMAGAIYASIENTTITSDTKQMFELSFNDQAKNELNPQDLYPVKLTRHLPEKTIYAMKLPEKGKDNTENQFESMNKTIDQSEELSDESDRSELINLISEIEVINKSLSNLTKYLPIAEIDSKAVNQPLISEKV